MKEITKARLNKLKLLAKKHGPAVLGAVGTVVASAVAVHFRNELVKLQTIDPDDWPVIEVHPELMKEIREGAVFMYREAKFGENQYLGQSTTMDEGFNEDANRQFKTFKETGEVVRDFDEPEMVVPRKTDN